MRGGTSNLFSSDLHTLDVYRLRTMDRFNYARRPYDIAEHFFAADAVRARRGTCRTSDGFASMHRPVATRCVRRRLPRARTERVFAVSIFAMRHVRFLCA